MYYKLYSDAAKSPSSDIIGIGVLLVDNHNQIQARFNGKAADNHEAEFKTCIESLNFFKSKLSKRDYNKVTLTFFSDSKILVDSLNKRYAKHYQNYVNQILELESEYNLVFNNWIPDNKNHGAHNLANQALHDLN